MFKCRNSPKIDLFQIGTGILLCLTLCMFICSITHITAYIWFILLNLHTTIYILKRFFEMILNWNSIMTLTPIIKCSVAVIYCLSCLVNCSSFYPKPFVRIIWVIQPWCDELKMQNWTLMTFRLTWKTCRDTSYSIWLYDTINYFFSTGLLEGRQNENKDTSAINSSLSVMMMIHDQSWSWRWQHGVWYWNSVSSGARADEDDFSSTSETDMETLLDILDLVVDQHYSMYRLQWMDMSICFDF